jgi:hypothetical protein
VPLKRNSDFTHNEVTMRLLRPLATAFLVLNCRALLLAQSSGPEARRITDVGIELGRACCRRRVTSLVLSVARWVHNSAMTTFSEAPL